MCVVVKRVEGRHTTHSVLYQVLHNCFVLYSILPARQPDHHIHSTLHTDDVVLLPHINNAT